MVITGFTKIKNILCKFQCIIFLSIICSNVILNSQFAFSETIQRNIQNYQDNCGAPELSIDIIQGTIGEAVIAEDYLKIISCGLLLSYLADNIFISNQDSHSITEVEQYDLYAVQALGFALSKLQAQTKVQILNNLISPAGLSAYALRRSDYLSYLYLTFIFSDDELFVRPELSIMHAGFLHNFAARLYHEGVYLLSDNSNNPNYQNAAQKFTAAAELALEENFGLNDGFLRLAPEFARNLILNIHLKSCFFGTFHSFDTTAVATGFNSCRHILSNYRDDTEAIVSALGALGTAEMMAYPLVSETDLIFLTLARSIDQSSVTVAEVSLNLDNCFVHSSECDLAQLEEDFISNTTVYENFFVNSSLNARLKIQASLKNMSWYDGEIDGLWGSLTSRAIQRAAIQLDTLPSRPRHLTERIFSLAPISDDDVRSIEEEIVLRALASNLPNYTSDQGVRDIAPRSPPTSIRSWFELPDLEDGSFDGGFSSIYIGNRFIQCHSSGAFTMCN